MARHATAVAIFGSPFAGAGGAVGGGAAARLCRRAGYPGAALRCGGRRPVPADRGTRAAARCCPHRTGRRGAAGVRLESTRLCLVEETYPVP
eukprot:1183724-Prorocentrum_minimum.AAC.2